MLFASCSSVTSGKPAPVISNYKDIPGITQSEIDTIELVKDHRDKLIYGIPESSEAFLMPGTGELGGFVSILGSDLSAFFGIEIEPQLHERDHLAAIFDAGQIDFTSEFSALSGQNTQYFASLPIANRMMMVYTSKLNGSLEEIKKIRRPRYAFLAASDMYSHVYNAEGDSFDAFFAQSGAELLSLLEDGTVDAFFEDDILKDFFSRSGIIAATDYYPLYSGRFRLRRHSPNLKHLSARSTSICRLDIISVSLNIITRATCSFANIGFCPC